MGLSRLFLCLVFLFAGCKNANKSTDAPNGTVELQQKEFEEVKTKAKSISKNKLGHWEATFGYGIVMIYVPQGSFVMGMTY